MAATKISALTALTGANSAPTDLLPIVDVSDTTMAASGTTKSITREELQTFPLGTITTDKKIADYSATWNNAAVTFTGMKLNVTDAASASASLLMDLQVGGSSMAKISKAGVLTVASGSAAAPSITFSGSPNSGMYEAGSDTLAFARAGTLAAYFAGNGLFVINGYNLNLNAAVGAYIGFGGSNDARIARASANSLMFSAAVTTVTSRTEINKAVASIADNTATATFTVTVPNAAHSAMLKVTLVGSLGAGGAVGANEATGTISYDFAIARTAGVATVVAPSTAYGSSTAAVAGAATITVTAAASAVSGANSATQTFTVNVTIAKGSGASANHTCLCYGRLLNANASGITIA